MSRAFAAVLVAGVVLAPTLPEARASSAGVSGGQLVFAAASEETNDVTIVFEATQYRVTDLGASSLSAQAGCTATSNPRAVVCSAAGVTSIGAGLLDGHDRLTVEAAVPAQVLGYGGVDTITGGAGDDELLGMDGGDFISGREGNDRMLELDDQRNVLDGGPGVDTITGGAGPDEVHGGPGDDRLLLGSEGDDLIDGGEGDDELDAGPGPSPFQRDADVLIGGPGLDRATYGRRAEPVRASMADGANDGAPGEGDDVRPDVEQLRGGAGNDHLVGGPADDAIDGFGGGDEIDAGPGADQLDGGGDDASGDTLRGGPGADVLSGRSGDDSLDGGEDTDRLAGEAGADRLGGGAGADTLDGGPGDDELEGGPGGDAIGGGEGIDTVRYPQGGARIQVTIDDVANDGEVALDEDGHTRIEEGATSREGDNVDATNERVTATRSDDTVEGDGSPNRLEGAAGEDFLNGSGGADTLSGGGASDAIVSRDGSRDRVSCGAGYDYVVADATDLVPRNAAACEYVDDQSRSAPRARRDMLLRPRCGRDRDAEISPPGTRRGMPVAQGVLAPLRSRVDALDCAVRLSVGVGGGRTLAGRLGGGTGMHRIGQRRDADGRLVTRMQATDCARPDAAARVRGGAARFRQLRYRRRYGRIAFPTELTLDSAVITKGRGVATWTVRHECGEFATVSVRSGRLAVLDLGTDRRVVLGPGESHRATVP
jgi:Ca2+-binding RTX toxin-like protein